MHTVNMTISYFKPSTCVLFVLLVAAALSTAHAQSRNAALLNQVQAGVAQAQACQPYLHDDADEYEACIDALARQLSIGGAKTQARKLGVLYFGFAGALNSARVSLPGAEKLAQRYARSSIKLKNKLKLSDAELCSALSGDCQARSAAMRQR
jgi:hypothetical protein